MKMKEIGPTVPYGSANVLHMSWVVWNKTGNSFIFDQLTKTIETLEMFVKTVCSSYYVRKLISWFSFIVKTKLGLFHCLIDISVAIEPK